MNILTVCHYHYQGTTFPSALFVHAQVKCFQEMGHRVRIVVPIPVGKRGENGKRLDSPVMKMTVDGVEHVFLRYLSLSNLGNKGLNERLAVMSAKTHYKKIVEDFTPDVIHGHKLGSNTNIAATLGAMVGCPVVFSLHGETSCEEPWLSTPALIGQYAKKADAVVCVSSALQRRVNEAWDGAVRVILNGFSLQHIPAPAEKKGLVFNQTGYLVPGKRVDVTLRAFAALQKKFPDAVLDIVGDGVEKDRLMQLSRELGVASAVTFHGYLENKKAIELMRNARFFIMASKPEGFGIVYLEAMANGCITIGTEGEGISDLIHSGENGFLVPADDPEAIVRAVEECLRDETLEERISREGIASAKELTWAANAEQYIEMFEQLRRRRQ